MQGCFGIEPIQYRALQCLHLNGVLMKTHGSLYPTGHNLFFSSDDEMSNVPLQCTSIVAS
jgi:hypothetical protein